MVSGPYDILGIGNAIVDVISQVQDDFLVSHELTKGTMTLIQEAPAEALLAAMGATTTVSGGSAANTVIGAAHLGCSACFIGRVRDDKLGISFDEGIRRAGVDFPVPHADTGSSTGRCFILVTPDGQRTMNTYLGACQDLSEADIDPAAVEAASVIYLEGYLWDPPAAKAAFLKAARLARAAGRKVALSLSDAFCVERYRDEFIGLIRDRTIDIVFANEAELMSLSRASDFAAAVDTLRQGDVLSVITRAEQGCVVVSDGVAIDVQASPAAKVVDTTGAGDLFAAGFVTGLVRGLDNADCARLGALAAAEIIQHIGARPQADLRRLASEHGLAI